MFEIGFWELVMVGVVALLVVGPERLPGLARTAGLWLGKARYFVSGVRAEIEREIKAEELRRALTEQAQATGFHEIVEETRQTLADTRGTLLKEANELTSALSVTATPVVDSTISPPSSTLATDAPNTDAPTAVEDKTTPSIEKADESPRP